MVAKSKKFVTFLYNHSFVRYVFVGGTTFTIDFLLLIFFHGFLNIQIAIATTFAYWTAIAYNFFLNRQWTFSAKDKSDLSKHATLYLLLLGFNYLFTLLFVSIASHHINYAVAKILAVAISVSWTYFVYRRIFTSS